MRIALCHGCFDILHIGHFRLLKHARAISDRLVVSVLSDEYIEKYKGRPPTHPLLMRIEQMKEIRSVSDVVIVDGPGHEAVERIIMQVRPTVYVKGEDTRGKFGEEPLINLLGIELVFVPMVEVGGISMSSTRGRREASLHHQ